jgi:glucose/arabinose dehydrogenase
MNRMTAGSRRFAHVVSIALVAATLTGLAGTTPAIAAATIHAKRIAGGLNDPVAFTFTPKGRIFSVEKGTGQIRLLNPATGSDHLFFTVSHVSGSGERGLLGIALHPQYPAKPYVYVYATRVVSGHVRNQILRITDGPSGGQNMTVLFSTRASTDPYHNGGRILFGPDGMLYAMVGEGHNSANSQDLTNDRGKVLRMTPRGTIPADAPIAGTRIFSYGNRNSFGFAFDPQNGNLCETENGPECNDEINLILPGKNYGWGPNETCSGSAPGNTNQDGPNIKLPKYYYATTLGITAGAFCEGCHLNATSEGTFFFGDVNNGRLYRATLNGARDGIVGDPAQIMSPGTLLATEIGPDGSVYFSVGIGQPGAIYKLVYN